MSGRIEDGLRRLALKAPIEPPAALEPRVLAAMARAAQPPRWPLLARAAALVASIGAAAWLAGSLIEPAGEEPVARPTAGDAAYLELVELSDYLEGVLASLPQRQIMAVSTAGTIVGLEDSIAWIDAELARAEDAAPEYRKALMRNRVEVMNALVNVRYAQSRAFLF